MLEVIRWRSIELFLPILWYPMIQTALTVRKKIHKWSRRPMNCLLLIGVTTISLELCLLLPILWDSDDPLHQSSSVTSDAWHHYSTSGIYSVPPFPGVLVRHDERGVRNLAVATWKETVHSKQGNASSVPATSQKITESNPFRDVYEAFRRQHQSPHKVAYTPTNRSSHNLGPGSVPSNNHRFFLASPRVSTTIPSVELPPSNMTESRIIFFLHIHKSAGTTMCNAARANGLVTTKTNCNTQRDQRCCGNYDTLEAQQYYAKITANQFVANERDMYEAIDTEHYRYIVTLRKSRSRYLSHWKNVVRWHYPNYTQSFTHWWKRQPDNWNVRKICGTRCMHVPKFQISRELFTYTVDRLRQFEDILLFERFNETFANFAQNVGWTRMPLPSEAYENITYPEFSTDDWDPLMSVLDDALYEIAEARQQGGFTKFSDPTITALNQYFSSGPQRDCWTLCCANKCSVY